MDSCVETRVSNYSFKLNPHFLSFAQTAGLDDIHCFHGIVGFATANILANCRVHVLDVICILCLSLFWFDFQTGKKGENFIVCDFIITCRLSVLGLKLQF